MHVESNSFDKIHNTPGMQSQVIARRACRQPLTHKSSNECPVLGALLAMSVAEFTLDPEAAPLDSNMQRNCPYMLFFCAGMQT